VVVALRGFGGGGLWEWLVNGPFGGGEGGREGDMGGFIEGRHGRIEVRL